jgi:hypothetical protein
MCVAHLLSATAGAVLVVQLRCTALACALATGRPTAMHQADRPIYVQVHSRSAFGQSTTRQPTSKGPCYSIYLWATMLMLDRLHGHESVRIWHCSNRSVHNAGSLAGQLQYTSTAPVEQGMPSCTAESSSPRHV